MIIKGLGRPPDRGQYQVFRVFLTEASVTDDHTLCYLTIYGRRMYEFDSDRRYSEQELLTIIRLGSLVSINDHDVTVSL